MYTAVYTRKPLKTKCFQAFFFFSFFSPSPANVKKCRVFVFSPPAKKKRATFFPLQLRRNNTRGQKNPCCAERNARLSSKNAIST